MRVLAQQLLFEHAEMWNPRLVWFRRGLEEHLVPTNTGKSVADPCVLSDGYWGQCVHAGALLEVPAASNDSSGGTAGPISHRWGSSAKMVFKEGQRLQGVVGGEVLLVEEWWCRVGWAGGLSSNPVPPGAGVLGSAVFAHSQRCCSVEDEPPPHLQTTALPLPR